MDEYREKWKQGSADVDDLPPVAQSGSATGHESSGATNSYGEPYSDAGYAKSAGPGHQQAYQEGDYRRDYQQPYQDPHGTQYGQGRPPYGYGQAPRIPSYMGWAIATLILCFWPTGIVAVVYASQVNNKLAYGDYAGAKESSRKAKMWSWISFGIALAGIAIAILMSIFAAAITFDSIY